MTFRPLVIVTLDGWQAASLGCYGSSWNATPAIDRLAASGTVWDRWIAPSTSAREILGRWFRPPADGDWQAAVRPYGSVDLVTDDAVAVAAAGEQAFDRIVRLQVDRRKAGGRPAAEPEQTRFGRLIAAAAETFGEGSAAIWLHTAFLAEEWDAPPDYHSFDPWDDPTAVGEHLDRHGPPRVRLAGDEDPDLVSHWMRSYAAQVRLVDEWLGVLWRSLRERDPMLVLTATGGFSLGQNGWIGHRVGPLRSCELRLPMILSPGPRLRIPHVTDAGGLPGLLRRSAGGDDDSPLDASSWAAADDEFCPAVISRVADWGDGQAMPGANAVTSRRWFLVRDPAANPDAGDSPGTRLFLKPDDVDDVNDVSSRSPDAVSRLSAMLADDA